MQSKWAQMGGVRRFDDVKPVTFKGNVTRKVWVPRGDQYRTPEKWMEMDE